MATHKYHRTEHVYTMCAEDTNDSNFTLSSCSDCIVSTAQLISVCC